MSLSPEPLGQSGGVNIAGRVDLVAGDIVGRDKIIYGPNAEETADKTVAKLVAVLEKRGVLRTAETAGLDSHTIIKLAQRLKPDERLNFEQAVTELQSAVEIALRVIARGEQGADQDDFVNAVLAQVAEKTRSGDLEGGASAIDQGLADLEVSYRRQRIALLEEGVKVDILRRNAVAVAWRIETLVAIDHPDERPAWLPAFRERFDAFYDEGDTKGINFSLLIAIELARRMLANARDSTERGMAGVLLGNALQSLGTRESGTERLEEAVAAFRTALKEWTREHTFNWANTHNSLGAALSRLGERESGTERLEEAVVAFRAALEENTRERVPLEWAMTQSNIGAALRMLGERESGTERLEEAVVAFRAALEENTRERVPLEWAMTQSNLGGALRMLGERESGTERLEEAVVAFRAALEERTRERVPLEWAMTQSNLGAALSRLGERESGTERLEEAVVAFRAALEENTRERVPLEWAAGQHNLGNLFRMLGERESGTERLEEAVVAFRAALEERTRERVPLKWANTYNNLGAALSRLGERESGTERLEEAVAAFDAALVVFISAGASYYVGLCQANRGRALELLDNLQGK